MSDASVSESQLADALAYGRKLAHTLAGRYPLDESDLIEATLAPITAAARCYRPDRGAWMPYARTAVFRALYTFVRAKRPIAVELDDTVGTFPSPESLMIAIEDARKVVVFPARSRTPHAA